MIGRRALAVALLLAGCGGLPPYVPPVVETEPPDAGVLLARRPYRLRGPDAGSSTERYPLVLILHGYGGEGSAAREYLGFDELARSQPMFVVAPDGERDSRGNRAWHPDRAQRPPWDVAYLTAVLEDVIATRPVDLSRVYVVGFSQGAHMAHRMGCDAAQRVAAVVSLSGQVSKAPGSCEPVRPVSVLQIHGTDDQAIFYEGDPFDLRIPSAMEIVGVWALANGCTGPLTDTGARLDLDALIEGEETRLAGFTGCPPGVAVELWTQQDSLHGPPLTDAFGPSVYGFLRDHPR